MASTDLLIIIITQFDFADIPKIIIQLSHPKNDIYPVSETFYMSNKELDLEMMKLVMVRDDDIDFDFWWLRQYFCWCCWQQR